MAAKLTMAKFYRLSAKPKVATMTRSDVMAPLSSTQIRLLESNGDSVKGIQHGGMSTTAAELAQMRTDVATMALSISCTFSVRRLPVMVWGKVLRSIARWQRFRWHESTSSTHLQNYDYLIGLTWVVNVRMDDVRVQDHLVIGSAILVVQPISRTELQCITTVLASEVR